MISFPFIFPTLATLNSDGRLLFATRTARLFAYGFLSVGLVLHLSRMGLSDPEIGLLLTFTLAGDTAISLWLTTHADRLGRRRMLMAGGALMILAGLVFVATTNFFWLLLAATIGVISPSGNEVGPFLAIEQAALSQVVADRQRTPVFAWYSLIGSFATAAGSLCGGIIPHWIATPEMRAKPGFTPFDAAFPAYAFFGVLLLFLFKRLSPQVEILPSAVGGDAALPKTKMPTGLSQSHGIMLRLSALFALDAFGGGFVIQSYAAYWFHLRWGADLSALGGIFFGANILAGLSALAAAPLARRFGLVNTMVFTHLPSNILLILVPCMPTFPLAVACLLLRFSISQMDVPTRQSYTMAVVRPEERAAAAGITGTARTIGAAIAPLIAGQFFSHPNSVNWPFFLAGGLKILYDILLYQSFIHRRPPEEQS